MNTSSYLFGFILATLMGALFHLWRDGGIGRLLLYLLLSWVGFLLGHWVGNSLGINFIKIGQVNLGGGIVGSALLLLLGHWISQVEPELRSKDN